MLTKTPLKEEFLHFVWRTRKFSYRKLTTTSGEPITIENFGQYNKDSGPDFFNARIKIGDTLWAGNVEMHVFSSDWSKHNHHNDKAYDNVILHVVYEHDKEIPYADGKAIPCLAIKDKIDSTAVANYAYLSQSESWIPCQKWIPEVDPFRISLWLERLLVERIEKKTGYFKNILNKKNQDWEECLYVAIARNLGAKVNMEPMEQLALSLPLRIILKNVNNLLVIEALLFGQAGMLEANFTDTYFQELKKAYRFHQKKYKLSPIPSVSWKFSKLRPVNFPTLRIAQFALILYKTRFLFSKIKEIRRIEDIYQLFSVSAGKYWETHYRFGKTADFKYKTLGRSAIDLLIINAIVPILFLYGKSIGDESYVEKGLSYLSGLKPEKNNIIKGWANLGIKAETSFDSQALIQLKNEYCNSRRCLYCQIGNEVMKLP